MPLPPDPSPLQPSADCTQPPPQSQCADDFCRVEAGCYIMGAPRTEWNAGLYSDREVQVTLRQPFEIGRTEVTRAQWEAEGFELPARIDGGDCTEASCPLTSVSFLDAITFANRYSEARRLPACYALSDCAGSVGEDLRCGSIVLTSDSAYACRGYRLPTEAEWEYAARAGTRTAFVTGGITPQADISDCNYDAALDAIGWYCHNANGRAHPVALKQPNALGLYDMADNIFEWCNDIFSGAGYGQGPLVDPTGTLTPGRDLMPRLDDVKGDGYLRILRGGNFVAPASMNKSSKRYAGTQYLGDAGLGFRLVRSLAASAESTP